MPVSSSTISSIITTNYPSVTTQTQDNGDHHGTIISTTIATVATTTLLTSSISTLVTSTLPPSTTSFDWTILPPIQDQICLQAGIKQPFYSILGNHYCQHTCLFKPMDECNLYLCFCNTPYLSTKNI